MSEDNSAIRAYSITEVSEQLGTPPGTLRQWEKDFELKIPRTANKVRYYTLFEIDLFQKIRVMREKGISVEMIRQLLNGANDDQDGIQGTTLIPAAPTALTVSEVVSNVHSLKEQVTGVQERLDAIPELLKDIVGQEVRKELLTGNKQLQDDLVASIRDQVLEAVKKEIMTGIQQAAVAAVEQEKKKTLWQRIFSK